jgi:formamidopyrimidine-DNA glycosylase
MSARPVSRAHFAQAAGGLDQKGTHRRRWSTHQESLKDAIAAGGSTLRDHAQATGDPGNFQHHFLVYGREGKPANWAARAP